MTGKTIEHAEAEHLANFARKFPQSVHVLDGVTVHCTGPNHDAVMWMSDWARCWELRDAGLLRVECGGPHNYGHDSLYVV